MFTLLFCAGFVSAILLNYVPIEIGIFYFIMSLITFVFYAFDKSAAKNGRWRISEKTLHLLSLFGGWTGAFCGQKWLDHKSTKKSFRRIYWLTVFLNLAGLVWLLRDQGADALHAIVIALRTIIDAMLAIISNLTSYMMK